MSKLPLPTALKSRLVLPRPSGMALKLSHSGQLFKMKGGDGAVQIWLCSSSSLRATSGWVAVCLHPFLGSCKLGLHVPSYSALLN